MLYTSRARKARGRLALSPTRSFDSAYQYGKLVRTRLQSAFTFINAVIGLYTSPHLVAVRERIRINGIPIGEEEFAKFFFEVWDRLGQNQVVRLIIIRLVGVIV